MTTLRDAAMGALLVCLVACASSEDEDLRAEWTPETETTCPVLTRGGYCRSAGPDEVTPIASGGLVIPAAGFPLEGEGFLAFSVRWTDARILAVRSPRLDGFEAAQTLPWEDADGAAGAIVGGRRLLYVRSKYGALRLVHVRDGLLEGDEPVAFEGEQVVPTWPQAVGLPDGRVLLAFVEPQHRVFLGVGREGGTRFHVRALPLPHDDLTGVLAHVGTTAEGGWVLGYQIAKEGWRFESYAVISTDEGASWSDPIRLSDADDVAGAFPIARKDGGADVYYVTRTRVDGGLLSADEELRIVRRRALRADGSLGPEQDVTSTDLGDVGYPHPSRLPDGRIALMMSTGEGVALVVLDGDAP